MPTEQTADAPFDEQAALAELERLQRAIEESRRRRNRTVDEFDAFVRSFGSAPPRATSPAPPMRDEVLFPPERPVAAPEPVNPSPVAAAPRADVDRAPEHAQGRRAKPSRSWWPVAVLTGLAVSAVVATVLLTRSRDLPAPETRPPASSVSTAPALQADRTPLPAPPASPAPAAAPPTRTPASTAPEKTPIEVIATKPVWMRVTIDGERVLERELKEPGRFQFRAEQVVLIRSGDAGAVRVTIAGQDLGPLGPDGIVMSRTYAVRR